ncbi:MAG: hypothetical protein J5908_06975 [Selenomonas sp.]|nr:hypothetical protein [Selenomonas sp.]
MMVSYHWASSLEQRSSAEMQIKMSLTIYTLVRLVSAIDNTECFTTYGMVTVLLVDLLDIFSRKGGIQACIGLHVFCLFAPSDAGNSFLH